MDMTVLKKKRISFIGAGALGGAVAQGLVRGGCKVLAADPYAEKLTHLRTEGVNLTTDNIKAAEEAEIVIFALKPHLTLGVVRDLASLLNGKLCASLAAAVPLQMLVEAAPGARWARAMSNICAATNSAFTGITPHPSASEEDRADLKALFSLVGEAEFAVEKDLDLLTALTGAGPAFFLSMLEAAAKGAIHAGLPKELAYRGAACTLLGAARLALESGRHPAALCDDVCTPGGMTIEGVYELERSAARGAMMKAVLLAAEKGRGLTEKVVSSLKQ
ncbi:MAG: NAD(P)-binding domain-containing protein [Fretibacterium sp.]|nr:NAD(P)-binding domain-containing protein [Fretibacterium sp.]